MTKVEVQVQDGKVIISVGGATAATPRAAHAAPGDANSVPSEPPDPPGEASVIVIGPLVLENAATDSASPDQKDDNVLKTRSASKDATAALKPTVKQSSSADHRVVVIGPICLPNGARVLNAK